MIPPADLALCPGCGMEPPCASQEEMRARHGTPEEFSRAVYACSEISYAEADAAVQRYARAYAAAGG